MSTGYLIFECAAYQGRKKNPTHVYGAESWPWPTQGFQLFGTTQIVICGSYVKYDGFRCYFFLHQFSFAMYRRRITSFALAENAGVFWHKCCKDSL